MYTRTNRWWCTHMSFYYPTLPFCHIPTILFIPTPIYIVKPVSRPIPWVSFIVMSTVVMQEPESLIPRPLLFGIDITTDRMCGIPHLNLSIRLNHGCLSHCFCCSRRCWGWGWRWRKLRGHNCGLSCSDRKLLNNHFSSNNSSSRVSSYISPCVVSFNNDRRTSYNNTRGTYSNKRADANSKTSVMMMMTTMREGCIAPNKKYSEYDSQEYLFHILLSLYRGTWGTGRGNLPVPPESIGNSNGIFQRPGGWQCDRQAAGRLMRRSCPAPGDGQHARRGWGSRCERLLQTLWQTLSLRMGISRMVSDPLASV